MNHTLFLQLCSDFSTLDMSIIVSVIVFLIGTFFTWMYDKNKKRRELILYKNLTIEMTKGLSHDIDIYIKCIDGFGDSIIKSDSLDAEKIVTNLFSFDKVNSLPFDKIADALYVNLDIKSGRDNDNKLYKLTSMLNFIDQNKLNLSNDYQIYVDHSRNLKKKWDELFEDISKNVSTNYNSPTDSSNDPRLKKFYREIGAIPTKFSSYQVDFKTINNSDFIPLSDYMKKYITPLTDFCNKDESLFEFKEIRDLSSILRQINCVNRDYQIRNQFGEQIKKKNIEMKKAHCELNSLIDYYDGLNIKSLWKIS